MLGGTNVVLLQSAHKAQTSINFQAKDLFYAKSNNQSIITHIQPRIVQLSTETTESNEHNQLRIADPLYSTYFADHPFD